MLPGSTDRCRRARYRLTRSGAAPAGALLTPVGALSER